MLILTAEVGEWIYVGDVRVQVNRIRNNKSVRVAIDAPRSVPVDREEIRRLKIADGRLKESK